MQNSAVLRPYREAASAAEARRSELNVDGAPNLLTESQKLQQTIRQELEKAYTTIERSRSYNPLRDANVVKAAARKRAKQDILAQYVPQAAALLQEAVQAVGIEGGDGTPIITLHPEQIIGGAALADGKIIDMKTGEGKSLTALLPAYLHALAGDPVHIATVNGYLAERDAKLFAPIFAQFNMRVAAVHNAQDYVTYGYISPLSECVNPTQHHTLIRQQKQDAYAADIVYGYHGELAHDYIKDNNVPGLELRVDQKPRSNHFCIIDEVDKILLDDAQIPHTLTERVPKPIHEDSDDYLRSLPNIVSGLRFSQQHRIRKLESELENLVAEAARQPSDEVLHQIGRALFQLKYAEADNPLFGKYSYLFRETYHRFETGIWNAEERQELLDSLEYTVDAERKRINFSESFLDQLERETPTSGDESIVNGDWQHQDISVLGWIKNFFTAKEFYKRGRDYELSDGKVVVLDRRTGRPRQSSRYSGGIHEAIEALEKVTISNPTRIIGKISLQQFFKLYGEVVGMSGTAALARQELEQSYGIPVVEIPTHKPCQRVDEGLVLFARSAQKLDELVEDLVSCHETGQPVLLGVRDAVMRVNTTEGKSTEISESQFYQDLLTRECFEFKVIDAKSALEDGNREAQIVRDHAGKADAITIATNMAGRGTDIKLSPEARVAGGLRVIPTYVPESVRDHAQFVGRAGRQGDPGSSVVYASLEDPFFAKVMPPSNLRETQELYQSEGALGQSARKLTQRAVRKTLDNIEERHADMRRRNTEFESVLGVQRTVSYKIRDSLLEAKNVADIVALFSVDDAMSEYVASKKNKGMAGSSESSSPPLSMQLLSVLDPLFETIRAHSLAVFDELWKEHMTTMEEVQETIPYRGLAGERPLEAYMREGHQMFLDFIDSLKEHATHTIQDAVVASRAELEQRMLQRSQVWNSPLSAPKVDPWAK